MNKPPKKLLRCAVYTRKSTEHNLDLEFNSLDAQREACEAYIKSQAHEGWRLIPDRFDDGAFSGASLDRPALQRLLSDVRSGHIDIIVVYKVDRLTRSLADFAKLVELFDQHSVSFVSVTQSFNTTSSMGRLTLNVLLSFAQFEREVIGERVRDKIAASKRKGIWVGGPVPLGYASIKKKLVVVPEEAETVRLIFQRYLELGSIRTLMADLDRKGVRTRSQLLADGQSRGGIRFGVGPLAHLLQNRLYVGEIFYREAVHAGEHEPIVDRKLFEAVQARLAHSAAARKLRFNSSPAILTGRIFDDRGNRMTPTHTNKRGARYRYYVSHAIMQGRNQEAGSVNRVPAPEVENAVVSAVRKHLAVVGSGERSNLPDNRALLEKHADRIIMKPDMIEIHLAQPTESEEQQKLSRFGQATEIDGERAVLTVPWSATTGSEVNGILHSPSQGSSRISPNRETLLIAIARARSWIRDLVEGGVQSFGEIAQREGKVERHIRLLAPLAFFSPKLIQEIIDGGAIPKGTVTSLARRLSYSWTDQRHGRPSGL